MLLWFAAMPIIVVAHENSASRTDNDSIVSSNEVVSALKGVDGILAQADQTRISADADFAMKTVTAGAQIDVPKDASAGVTLGSSDTPLLNISLPHAAEAGDAKTVAAGTVAYSGTDGSANAVQATEDGGVRMLSVIDNPNAPTTYSYGISIPEGGRVEIASDGGAIVYDMASNAIATVGAPWAEDATGRTISTYFTTDGSTLTQHVEHNAPGTIYPVTADPIWFAISAGIFWWAVQRCGAGGVIGAVFEYVGGSRSRRAIAAAGAAGCIAGFVGGWGILKNMVRIIRW